MKTILFFHATSADASLFARFGGIGKSEIRDFTIRKIDAGLAPLFNAN